MKDQRSWARTGGVLFFVGAGILAASGGCGGPSGEANPGVLAPVTLSGFAAAFGHAVCDNVGACCHTSGFGFDASNCFIASQGLAQAEVVNPALAAGRTYDRAAASACLTVLAGYARSCDDLVVARETGSVNTLACAHIAGGMAPPGAACSVPSDCKWPSSGAVQCVHYAVAGSVSADGGTTPPSTSGLCQVTLPGTEGAACTTGSTGGPPAATVNDCGLPGSPFNCVQGVCVSKGAVGATCLSGIDCADDDYCNGGSCAARLPVGSPCDPTQQACVLAGQCDFPTSTCVSLLATGEPCQIGTSGVCLGECDGTVCRSSSLASAGTCGG